jgi:hypothetical protein
VAVSVPGVPVPVPVLADVKGFNPVPFVCAVAPELAAVREAPNFVGEPGALGAADSTRGAARPESIHSFIRS